MFLPGFAARPYTCSIIYTSAYVSVILLRTKIVNIISRVAEGERRARIGGDFARLEPGRERWTDSDSERRYFAQDEAILSKAHRTIARAIARCERASHSRCYVRARTCVRNYIVVALIIYPRCRRARAYPSRTRSHVERSFAHSPKAASARAAVIEEQLPGFERPARRKRGNGAGARSLSRRRVQLSSSAP